MNFLVFYNFQYITVVYCVSYCLEAVYFSCESAWPMKDLRSTVVHLAQPTVQCPSLFFKKEVKTTAQYKLVGRASVGTGKTDMNKN
jgi:hypothetical protein